MFFFANQLSVISEMLLACFPFESNSVESFSIRWAVKINYVRENFYVTYLRTGVLNFSFRCWGGKMSRGRQNTIEIHLLFISEQFRVTFGDNAIYSHAALPMPALYHQFSFEFASCGKLVQIGWIDWFFNVIPCFWGTSMEFRVWDRRCFTDIPSYFLWCTVFACRTYRYWWFWCLVGK